MIIKPFNVPYFIMLLTIAAASFVLYKLLNNKPQTTKRNALFAICAINFILFFVYKSVMSYDDEYLILMQQATFTWLTELPLHLCNINLYLLPISIALKKKSLMLFSFSTSTLGAFLAITLPDQVFVGYSLLTPRVFFYYFVHALLLVCAISLISLGFYRPRFKDIPKTLVCLLLIGLAVHGINILLHITAGVEANYFYTIMPGNGAMEFFWNFIPMPFFYILVPAYFFLSLYLLLICLAFRPTEKGIE